jgi:uncharacterized membrane protein YdjX (TVP38/TMEM64 family)
MSTRRNDLVRLVLPLVLVGALAVAWHIESFRSILESLPDRMESLAAVPGAHVLFVAAFVVAGFVAVPLSVLIVTTAAALGPVEGAIVSWIGGMASGVAVFLVGRITGRRAFQALVRGDARAVVDRITDRGTLAVALIRNVPVAPYSVVNLAAGASPVRLRDFTVGTAIGLLPGVAMLTMVGDRLMRALRSPGAGNLAVLAGVLIALALLGVLTSRKLNPANDGDED